MRSTLRRAGSGDRRDLRGQSSGRWERGLVPDSEWTGAEKGRVDSQPVRAPKGRSRGVSRRKALGRREGAAVRPRAPKGRPSYSRGEVTFVLAWLRAGLLISCWECDPGTVPLQLLIDALGAVPDPWKPMAAHHQDQGRVVVGGY